jgi:hypothetical protein
MDHFSRLLCWPVLSPVFFLVFRLRLTGSLAFYFRRRPVFITVLFPSPFRSQGFTVLALCGKPVCFRTVLVKRFWRFFFLATFAYFHDTLPDIYYHCHNRYANNKDNVAFIANICCKNSIMDILSAHHKKSSGFNPFLSAATSFLFGSFPPLVHRRGRFFYGSKTCAARSRVILYV